MKTLNLRLPKSSISKKNEIRVDIYRPMVRNLIFAQEIPSRSNGYKERSNARKDKSSLILFLYNYVFTRC